MLGKIIGADSVFYFSGKIRFDISLFSAALVIAILIFSAPQTRKKGIANSVDLDEMAHMSRLIRLYTVCYFYFATILVCVLF